MKKILNSLLVVALLVGLFFSGLYFNDIKSWATSLFERGQIADGDGDDNGGDTGGDIEINSISFAEDDWSIIAKVSKEIAAGEENIWYEVGDEKDILIGEEIYTVHILGFNHDDLSDGTGKAGITIGMKHLLSQQHRLNPTMTNVGSWNQSEFRTTTLPSILETLPSDLQSVVKAVDKQTATDSQNTSLVTTSDKLFIFSEEEITGVNIYGSSGEGMKYEYWEQLDGGTFVPGYPPYRNYRIKNLSNGTGATSNWWLRSPTKDHPFFSSFDTNGNFSAAGGHNTYGICFGFCV